MIKFAIPSIAASIVVLSMGFTPALAASDAPKPQDMHNHNTLNHGQMNHDQMTKDSQPQMSAHTTEALPKEPGQGAFATIAEIVALLTNDPMTDWSKVNIDGLREHLIDMDELSLRASSKTTTYDDKIVFTVTGSGRTKQAIQAMVPAHSGVLSRTTEWDVTGELIDTGAIMTVSSDNPAVLKVIKALGFYGVMATGAHHQAHHLAMAKGDNSVHAHN